MYSIKKRIMIIDDYTDLADTLNDILSDDFIVEVYYSAESALETFKLKPSAYDLVIIDMVLPGISGTECLREMRKYNKNINAIAITGYCKKENEELARAERVLDFMKKPLNMTQLEKHIKRIKQQVSIKKADMLEDGEIFLN